MEEVAKFYRNVLMLPTSDKQVLPDHGVYTIFVELGGMKQGPKIELLEPYGLKSPIQAFLDKNPKGGIHHVCYEVDSLDNAIKDLSDRFSIQPIQPKSIGAHGKPVVFLHPKDAHGVLLELEQA